MQNGSTLGQMRAYCSIPARGILARLLGHTRATVALAVGMLCAVPGPSAADDAVLWRALRSGGHVALMRHALAPGTGDPREFVLRDCRTQRNLSKEGRDQAARIGARFRENGIQTARVFSSQWCRCLDTARLLELGPIQELPTLNSFFRKSDQREPQTQALRNWLGKQDLDEALVLVTHQVNITALTNIFPASGEIVVLRRSSGDNMLVVGTIETDYQLAR